MIHHPISPLAQLTTRPINGINRNLIKIRRIQARLKDNLFPNRNLLSQPIHAPISRWVE